jgi:hypothetical protein
MGIEEFAEFLVTNIAIETDLVKVKKFQTEEDTILEILVSESDMSRVIGRQGKVANSIKNLIQAKAYNDGISNIKINIDSF